MVQELFTTLTKVQKHSKIKHSGSKISHLFDIVGLPNSSDTVVEHE